jgi:hypothetical protein
VSTAPPWTDGQTSGNIATLDSDKEVGMALSAHLYELSEKHRQLDRRITEEMARPGSDDLEIRRMKQQKLKIKEEIDRLRLASRH